jgi:hypothetical protein
LRVAITPSSPMKAMSVKVPPMSAATRRPELG